jgi:hypothetical protein
MAKKTARPAAKPGQQRSKEEQWRRRMAQQSQAGVSNIATPTIADSATALADDEAATVPAKAGSTARRASGATPATQRAASAAARGARSRLATATMSLDDEMRYIRADIGKLVVLTSICVVIIIALAFILPSVIK